MSCTNCGKNSCLGGCDPANIRIPVGPTGPIGPQGAPGIAGTPGTNGVGIVSTSYNSLTGELTLIYSDGTTFTTGDLRGPQGPPGNPSPAIATSVYSAINQSYATYSAFIDTDLAKWRSLITPIGTIMPFALSLANFDINGYGKDLSGSGGSNLLGWAICDGSTYTKSVGTGNVISPDLQGKFIVGYDGADPDFSLANTGGSKNHTHDNIILNPNQLPDHTHGINLSGVGGHTHDVAAVTISSSGAHSHKIQADQDSGSGGSTGIQLTQDPTSEYYQTNWIYGGEHSHTVPAHTTDPETINILGNTNGQNGTTGNSFDTTLATNQNAEANAMPPYYTLIYLIKI